MLRARRRGFTLIELLTAMTLVSLLAVIAMQRLHSVVEQAKIARAIAEIRTLQADIDMHLATYGTLPATLADVGWDNFADPWGNPYVYFPFPSGNGGGNGGGGRRGGSGGGGGGGLGQARKDKNLVPINSTYDLYSMGADGKTQAPLVVAVSHDDIIRANDGAYIGLAKHY